MIFTVDRTDVNYNSLVDYVDEIFVDSIKIHNCIYINTYTGEYTCYINPFSVVNSTGLTEDKQSNNIRITFKNLFKIY